MRECPFCWDLSIDLENSINHGFPYIGQTIAECESCHAKVNVDFDYSFEDGHWRDCSTIRPLLALPYTTFKCGNEWDSLIHLEVYYTGIVPR